MGETIPRLQLGVIGALALSVTSSVAIVICNKALMSNLGFPFATTLTSWDAFWIKIASSGRCSTRSNYYAPTSLIHLLHRTKAINQSSTGVLTFVCYLLWSIWIGRNDLLYKSANQTPAQIAMVAVKLAEEYLHIQRAEFNVFETKAVDTKTVMLFGILNGVSIGLLNLSLGFNSIGFYQMTKLAIIPFTVLLETLFLKNQFSQNIKFSLSILLLGVGIASITDLQLNLVGSIISLLAIATTCVGQILTNTIQKRLNVSSTQLLYQSAPFQAGILFVSGPLVDQCLTKQNVFAYKYSPFVLAFIILSCVISVSVNFSTFWVIGKTSPVTYQVLGHLKTCLVLGFGYTLLHDPFTNRNIIGILVAMFGMGLYSYFCTRENKKKQINDLSSLSSHTKETTPFLGSKNNMGHQEEVKNPNKDSLV